MILTCKSELSQFIENYDFLHLDPDAVFQASLAMAGYMLSMESPTVTNILKAGHPVIALSSLLYGPTTVNQVEKCILRYCCIQNRPITYMSSAKGLG